MIEEKKCDFCDGEALALEEHRDDVVGGVTYHRSERTTGHQTRSLQLPSHADSSKVTAKLEHGVLTVTAPKVAGYLVGGRRHIAITA